MYTKIPVLFGLIVIACCKPAFPADIAIAGPSLGYYTDPATNDLHMLLGIPGSATIGPAFTTSFDKLWAGPNGRTAIGLRQGVLYLLKDLRDTTVTTPLMAWQGSVDTVAWSSDSSGVLVFSSGRGIFQSVTGLQATAQVNSAVNVRTLGKDLISIRISASPWTVALLMSQYPSAPVRSPVPTSAGRELFVITQNRTPVLVSQIHEPGAFDFSADGHNLFVVDRSLNQLMRAPVTNPRQSEPIVFSSGTLEPSDFSAIAMSADGLRLFAFEQHLHQACGVDTVSWTQTFCSDLEVAPAGVETLSGNLYLIAAPADGITPLWLLEADSGRTFFIPRRGQR